MSRTVSLLRFMRKQGAYMPPAPIARPQAPVVPPTAQPGNAQVSNAAQSFSAGLMRKQPHVLGTGVPQTGLPPSTVKAPSLPGAPGGVASNPIDTHGALGPAGTVDGNHAAGVPKGFKIG